MKQDVVGVRTAQDLERKYNFSSMQKAIKQSEQGIVSQGSDHAVQCEKCTGVIQY